MKEEHVIDELKPGIKDYHNEDLHLAIKLKNNHHNWLMFLSETG